MSYIARLLEFIYPAKFNKILRNKKFRLNLQRNNFFWKYQLKSFSILNKSMKKVKDSI